MSNYRVAFYYSSDCRAEEFVTASSSVSALAIAIDRDPKVYGNWEHEEGFYIIVELK